MFKGLTVKSQKSLKLASPTSSNGNEMPGIRKQLTSTTKSQLNLNEMGKVESVPPKPQDYMFYFSLWQTNTSSFLNLLNSSKGRDKFCQLLQYLCNFYVTCMRESEEFRQLVREKKIESVLKAKRMESSLSNGRKIFRLFLFLNEISEMYDLIQSKSFQRPLGLLKVISTCCSFVYYLTDNIVWLANLGFTSSFVPFSTQLKWKQIKNLFSLAKTVLEIIIAFKTVHQRRQEEAQIAQ